MKNNLNREYLVSKAKQIKENNNMLGIRVTIPKQKETELIINDNTSIDNKVDYYCKAYDETLVHSMNDQIKIVDILEIKSIGIRMTDEEKIIELQNRGFRIKLFPELGQTYFKNYVNEFRDYTILVAQDGDVLIRNNKSLDSKNVISFSYNPEFLEDLLFILQQIEFIKE